MSSEETQNTLAIAKLLSLIAKRLMKDGFPQDPMIAQGDPKDHCCFFLALWKNDDKTRELEKIEVQTRSIPT